MKNSKLKSVRITNLVFSLSVLGALLSIGIYVYGFHIINIVGTNNASLQAEATQLSTKESQVGELKKTLADNQAKEPILTSYFIDANDIVPFLETIEGYGKQTNVAVKFSTVNIMQTPDRLVVEFTGDGTFANLYQFLALVEAAPYEFSIDTATIQLGNQNMSQPLGAAALPQQWEASLQLSVLSITGVQHTATTPGQ